MWPMVRVLLCENGTHTENEAVDGYLCRLSKNFSEGAGCYLIDEHKVNQDPHVTDDHRKAKGIVALLSESFIVRMQFLLPKVRPISNAAVRWPFKSLYYNCDPTPRQAMFVLTNLSSVPQPFHSSIEEEDINVDELPPCIEPLMSMWEPGRSENIASNFKPIFVDPRPHQRADVQFMFECITGLLGFSKTDEALSGSILDDDMGLGTTLQSITLPLTPLKQGFNGSPIANGVLIVIPTSLVSDWESEIQWIGGRVQFSALCDSRRADVLSGIASFPAPCSSYQALAASQCRMLPGTLMQNDLEDFLAAVNFTNPGVLGDCTASFCRYIEAAAHDSRDGQKKRISIYRFLSAGTMEEKLSKDGLQKVLEHQQVDDTRCQVTWLSSEDLRDIFSLHENARSDTHENLNDKRCKVAGAENDAAFAGPEFEPEWAMQAVMFEDEADIGRLSVWNDKGTERSSRNLTSYWLCSAGSVQI